MTQKKRLVVNLPPDAYERLERLSDETGNSINSYIRTAIHRFLQEKERAGGGDE